MKTSSRNGTVTIDTQCGSFVFPLEKYSFEFDNQDIQTQVYKGKTDKRRVGGHVYTMAITINGLSKSFVLNRNQVRKCLETKV